MSESTTTTTSFDISDDEPSVSSPTIRANTAGSGLGLSDPKVSRQSREMLDLVNKLQSTGYAQYFTVPFDLMIRLLVLELI
jgi:hypothetical protein